MRGSRSLTQPTTANEKERRLGSSGCPEEGQSKIVRNIANSAPHAVPETSAVQHRSSSPSAETAETALDGASLPGHKSSGTSTSQGEQSSGGSMPGRHGESGFAQIQSAAKEMICNPLRQIVSQNRRRFKQDGFDLDLTYITDRIIAMGYPANATEAFYRNSMTATRAFLEKRHSGHYKVFNLRGQYVYDTSNFHNRVLSFEMTDHHPPRLELMAPFCREVHEYLEEDHRNIVAVHCKAGKGRTGVMICAYLMYIKFYDSPRQNMDYYSIVRTVNNKGVTIPSQRRYVYYFSHLREYSLNYMPLRLELIGIYVERPPKVSRTLVKGGLSLRVANGDVDVFIGEDMWISREEWEEEERQWSGGTCSRGEDSMDPSCPERTGNVIGRRVYGWTVPANKRVFLEGDVRVDIYNRQKVRLFPIENEKKKKLGHIWWNTMFACPEFCGGYYQHGDEAHPYPPGATTIAQRAPSGHRSKSGSASLPSSPPHSTKVRVAGTVSGRSACRAPSFDARKTTKPSKINHVVKKITDVTSRNSEPNIERKANDRQSAGRKKGTREKVDGQTQGLQLFPPPGLQVHCPQKSLEAIYGDKDPPRKAIECMLQDAHTRNIINDSYNERRLSVPQGGAAVPKAPEGRPNASGPNCLLRRPDEHAQIYSVLEVDRAFKNKDVDPEFKVIVVTRCVSVDSFSDQDLSNKFMKITHEKQEQKDKNKQMKNEDQKRKMQAQTGEQVNTDSCRSESQWKDDPRVADPHLKKFFYRQRNDSLSRYPNNQYRCPLLRSSEPLTDRPPVTPCCPIAASNESFTGSRGDDVDLDVSSYHPDDGGRCGSGSSEGTSESDPDYTLGAEEDPDYIGLGPNAEEEEARTPIPPSSN